MTLATGEELLKEFSEYAFAAGKLARRLEEYNEAAEAFLAENSNESTHTRSRRMGSDRERTANERLSQ